MTSHWMRETAIYKVMWRLIIYTNSPFLCTKDRVTMVIYVKRESKLKLILWLRICLFLSEVIFIVNYDIECFFFFLEIYTQRYIFSVLQLIFTLKNSKNVLSRPMHKNVNFAIMRNFRLLHSKVTCIQSSFSHVPVSLVLISVLYTYTHSWIYFLFQRSGIIAAVTYSSPNARKIMWSLWLLRNMAEWQEVIGCISMFCNEFVILIQTFVWYTWFIQFIK